MTQRPAHPVKCRLEGNAKLPQPLEVLWGRVAADFAGEHDGRARCRGRSCCICRAAKAHIGGLAVLNDLIDRYIADNGDACHHRAPETMTSMIGNAG